MHKSGQSQPRVCRAGSVGFYVSGTNGQSSDAATELGNAAVKLQIDGGSSKEMSGLKSNTAFESDEEGERSWSQTERLQELYEAIRLGANSFLVAEYKMCAAFVAIVGPLIFFLISKSSEGSTIAGFSALSFVIGAVTSMISGWIGTAAGSKCRLATAP